MRTTISVVLITFLSIFSIINDANSTVLPAPDGTYVEIIRDDYGVPHIVGDTEYGVFFGQGFVTARDRLVQMEKTRKTALGKLASVYGLDGYQNDWLVRTLGWSHAERVEKFENYPADMQDLLNAYSDGVNAYLDSIISDPVQYMPQDLLDYTEMEYWTPYDCIAISEYRLVFSGTIGGQELERLQELEEHGWEWFNENRPINDPTAPTTIHGEGIALHEEREYSYCGIRVSPHVGENWARLRKEADDFLKSINVNLRLGSYAVLVGENKTRSGGTMLLGCPQMGEPQIFITNTLMEIELFCPTLHIAGSIIPGIPGIIPGRNEHFAVTATNGHSDNCDLYIETLQDTTLERYLFNDEWVEFETVEDTIYVLNIPTTFTKYYSVHGPVITHDLPNQQAFTLKMSVKNSINEFDWGYNAWKASNVEEFEELLWQVSASYNFFYAGNDGTLKYWLLGHYNDRTDGVDPRLPHNGDGSEEWGGIIPFEELPQATNLDQDYFVNWNNKPVWWWDNGDVPAFVGEDHVTLIDDIVVENNAFKLRHLKNIPREIGDHGTYQQAIEFQADTVLAENLTPPGQSAFISITGEHDPHLYDQWPLHLDWDYKDFIFLDDVAPSITVELDAVTAPPIIPPEGGDLVYDITVTNQSVNAYTGEGWLEVVLPDGDLLEPLSLTGFVIPGGETVSFRARSFCPPYAPQGIYTLRCNIGQHPEEIIATDGFPFLKTNTTLLMDIPDHRYDGWRFEDWILIESEDEEVSKPNEVNNINVDVSAVFPNPFNAFAKFYVTVSQPSNLEIALYNINGQVVSIITDDYYQEGTHSFDINAENLANGVYFIRTSIPGMNNIIKKIVYVK